MSLPEVLLWQRLKGSPQGVSFRKQHPIDPYVVDFYCSDARLVVEIEGKLHDLQDRPQRDDARFAFLSDRGYRVLRMAADEVLKNPDGVAASIVAHAESPLHHPAEAAVPACWGHAGVRLLPPRAGEDLE